MAHILLVDDDPHIREVVRFALQAAGHTVHEAVDGQDALDRFAAQPADAVVLDIMMPELDGLEVCRRLRTRSSQVPILFLSSKDDEFDRVLGLELGADDYVTKPFSPRELVARVKAMLRRAAAHAAPTPEPGSRLTLGTLALDPTRHRCWVGGTEVVLTVTEFDLLRALFGFVGKAYSRDELIDRVWGAGHHITDRTIDSHVRRIR
ncbi:MAG: response regulator transcription factor, partial [Myxococcales bacterium]|nr:response regulator transcription factor [Myxococcales bacterium]